MKRIGLVLSNTLNVSPYVKYFTTVFDRNNISYNIICWNRNNFPIEREDNIICFDYTSLEGAKPIEKLKDYYKFGEFVKQHVKSQYDYLVVFDVASAFFIYSFLKKQFKNKYILDIRDHSPLITPLKLTGMLRKIIGLSSLTTISSEGYKEWLPKNEKYVLSHNFNLLLIDEMPTNHASPFSSDKTNIVTVGVIREFDENKRLIDNCSTDINYSVSFVGYGSEYDNLKLYSSKLNNVFFLGRYNKNDEREIVMNYDLINLIHPDNLHCNTAMSNRFYMCLMYKRPLIVNKSSVHSMYVSKYNLGVVVEANDDIVSKIELFKKDFDYEKFVISCNFVLNLIKDEQILFENKVEQFIKNSRNI
ncbi:MAG: hypothetical protein EOM47_08975 [Bacteroidia bacterium]|nr:hypothetical protein [Bacteroidia bacterium]